MDAEVGEQVMGPKYPDAVVRDFGRDGNAFALVGQVSAALRRAGHSADVEAFRKEATSGDYDHVIQTCLAWADCRYAAGDDDDEEWDDDDN